MDKEIFTEINSRKYSYYEFGNGSKNLVVLHGLTGGNTNNLNFFKSFSPEYKCYIPDLPAHHNIPLYDINDLTGYAGYVLDFVESKNLYPCDFAGYSFGGLVAIRLAQILKERDKETKIIIWSTPLERSYLTIKGIVCTKLISWSPDPFYRFLLNSKISRKIFYSLGIKLSDPDMESLKVFDNKHMYLLDSLIPTVKQDTKGLKIIYIYGINDAFVRDDAYEKTEIQNPDQYKYKFINGGHFRTNESGVEIRQKMLDFLQK